MISSLVRFFDPKAQTAYMGHLWRSVPNSTIDFIPADVSYGDGAFVLANATDKRFFYSHDLGHTWLPATVPAIAGTFTMRSIAFNNGRFLAVGSRSSGPTIVVLASDDRGVTWQQIATWTVSSGYDFLQVIPYKNNWAGVAAGVFRMSVDNGVTWSGELLSPMSTPYIATNGKSIMVSHQAGVRIRSETGVWTNHVFSLNAQRVCCPLGDGYMVYPHNATKNHALTFDDGATWENMPNGLSNTPAVNTIAFGEGMAIMNTNVAGQLHRIDRNGISQIFLTESGRGQGEYGANRFIYVAANRVSHSYGGDGS